MFSAEFKGRTVFHLTAHSNKIDVFQGVFNLAKENLTTDVISKLFLATGNEGGAVFHMAATLNEIRVC